MKDTLDYLITKRDKLQKRLDLVNVRCEARDKLIAQIQQIDVVIAQISPRSA